MSPITFSDELLQAVRDWLGEDGLEFFQKCLDDHGKVDPILTVEGPIPYPHPVHFREGMQVRNFLRTRIEYIDWEDHQLDDIWTKVIEQALRHP
jgi:hypothetical protein